MPVEFTQAEALEALQRGIRDEGYSTVRYGWVSSYSGRATLASGRTLQGFGPKGGPGHLSRDGGIEVIAESGEPVSPLLPIEKLQDKVLSSGPGAHAPEAWAAEVVRRGWQNCSGWKRWAQDAADKADSILRRVHSS